MDSLTIKTELVQNVSKEDLIKFYKTWEEFHNFLITFRPTKYNCHEIVEKFRYACNMIHEKWCRKITESPDKEEREKLCPMYTLCGKSGQMKGHKLYCELAAAANENDFRRVRSLLKQLDTDSLIALKKIRDTW